MDASNMCLTGTTIRLEFLNKQHFSALQSAAQNPAIWTYTLVDASKDFEGWLNNALEGIKRGNEIPFVVIDANDKIIGSTRFYDIVVPHQRLQIGYTWYVPEVWGTSVNKEVKLLLLTYAFEQLHCNRVAFSVDARNLRSRRALLKLGAKEEGILRQHMIVLNDYVRDTVMFSIVRSEWPEIKQRLLGI